MKRRSVFMALFIAFFAVVLLWSFMAQKEKRILELKTAVSVAVAKEDIAALTVLDETKLTLEKIPKKYVQPGYYGTIESLSGLMNQTPIRKGEQILQTKLIDASSQPSLSIQVTPGKRAMTVPVTDIHGVARLIKPGDHVDLLSSIDYGSSDREEREVKTVLQDINVLATGKHSLYGSPLASVKDPFSGEEKKIDLRMVQYTHVTLEVTPEQAQAIVFLMTSGEGAIFLSLRNPDDRSIQDLFTTDADRVLGERSLKGKKHDIRARRQPRWLEFRETTITPGF